MAVKKSKQVQQTQAQQRSRMHKRLLLLLLAAVLTFIIIPKGGFVPDYYRPGDIAVRDIKTPRDVLVPEPELTVKKKQHAEQGVLQVYDYDTRPTMAVATSLVNSLQSLADENARVVKLAAAPKVLDGQPASSQAGAATNPGSVDSAVPEVNNAGSFLPAPVNVAELLGVELTGEQLAALRDLSKDAVFLKRFKRSVSAGLQRKIVGNLELFKTNWNGSIAVRDLETKKEVNVAKADDVLGLNEVVPALSSALFGTAKLQSSEVALLSVVQKMIRPNLTFSQSETEVRRRAASEAVLPVLLQVKRGEMIVREGERISEEQVRKLKALQSSVDGTKTLRSAFGLMLLIAILFYTLHRFAKVNIRKYDPQLRDLLFLALIFVSFFIVTKVGIFTSTAMQSAFPYIDSVCYYYAFPFAAGAMLVRIVLNSEVAYVFALLFALLVGMLFGNNMLLSIYVLVGGITASHWVRHSKARSNLYRAGMYLSLSNMAIVLAIFALSDNPLDIQLLYRLGFAFIGGFGCAVIVNGTIPIVESLFKYTTDFKLLELANMNTPILRELMIQAPGTYHHSIIVGSLVENAAEAIGANPLLARVAAYYHDIGKIKKPLYFAENMRLSENKHDKLAPSMSALILISHVKDGSELAREHKLGQSLIDIIHQHHGTSLIKFFYDKAQQRDKDAQVKEQDYRYPGPKPQTREAALIMLADSVEAAGRTLSEPTPARIQGMVQKIINKIFIDGQLDECELTLKDLHEIAKSFNRVLSGIFHNRVDYPEPAYKERDKEQNKEAKPDVHSDVKGDVTGGGRGELKVKKEGKADDDLHRESTRETRDSSGRTKDSGSEDLKRLGMS